MGDPTPYYYGLHSNLELIATTLQPAQTARPINSLDSGYPAKKALSVVGDHPFHKHFETSVACRTTASLSSTEWLSIIVIRLGYLHTKDDPLVVLIKVKSGTVKPGPGEQLVKNIKAVYDG